MSQTEMFIQVCDRHTKASTIHHNHHSFLIEIIFFAAITVMVFDDNDDDDGQRRPWLRSPRWSWSSNVMSNGVDLMGALCDKFQAGALGHSLDTSHVFLEYTLDPRPCLLPYICPSWSAGQAQCMGLCGCCQIPTICKPLIKNFLEAKSYHSHRGRPMFISNSMKPLYQKQEILILSKIRILKISQ